MGPSSSRNRSVAGVASNAEDDTEATPLACLANPSRGRGHRHPSKNDRINTRREVLELTGGGRIYEAYENTEQHRDGITDGRNDKCLSSLDLNYF